jgi:competence protein ComEA
MEGDIVKINILGKQVEVRTEFAVIAGAVLVLLGCLAGYLFLRDTSDIIIENSASAATVASGSQTGRMGGQLTQSTTSPCTLAVTSAAITGNLLQTTGTAVAAEQIKVYVVGCVNKPGIVTLEKGQVIDDAVRLAGGLTEDADAGNINMVYKLNENTMLYIKSKKEIVQMSGDTSKNPASETTAMKSVAGKSTETGNLGKGAEIVSDSGGSVDVKGSGGSNGEDSDAEGSTIININTADTAELDKLPGVGEATAREIIAYREKNGPFRKIEEIMKVPRIKQGRFDSIKDLICVN